jgi:hypothetical protein
VSDKLVIQVELKLIVAILTEQSALDITADLNWQYFIKLVIRHRVIEQIYTRLKTEENVPDTVMQRLETICQRQRLRLLMLGSETIRLSRELTSAGIGYAVVKGIPLAVDAYGGITKRQCKDIDLWVDFINWDQAVKVLQSCGYQQTRPEYSLTGFKRGYYLSRNHDFEFFHPQKKVQVELMFRVSYLGVDFPKLSEVPLKQCDISSNLVMSLEDNYHLLLLIVHGAVHAWHRLRWLLDIYLLIQQQKVNLVKLLTLAEQFECKPMVIQCLWLLNKIFNLNNQDIKPLIDDISKKDLRLAKLLFEFVLADYELTGGHGLFNRMFYKYRWYLTQITPPKQRWRIIRQDLFKIDKTFKELTLPAGWEFGYYLLYPLYVIKYIVRRNF